MQYHIETWNKQTQESEVIILKTKDKAQAIMETKQYRLAHPNLTVNLYQRSHPDSWAIIHIPIK